MRRITLLAFVALVAAGCDFQSTEAEKLDRTAGNAEEIGHPIGRLTDEERRRVRQKFETLKEQQAEAELSAENDQSNGQNN